MEHIPVHKLQSSTGLGFEIWHSGDKGFKKDGMRLGAHRDDHYIFFLMEEGEASLMVDFTEICIAATSVYYVLPGQVHHGIKSVSAAGWFLAVDTSLISVDFRTVLENGLLMQQPRLLDADYYQRFVTIVEFLHQQFSSNNNKAFSTHLTQGLLNSFLAMTACLYSDQINGVQTTTRPMLIAHNFKKLLTENFMSIKSPAAYARLLHISESYLNEALKKITGLPVSYWILHEVMIEAKRLLYYSQLNIKEIAHQLGYDDHTYFSRLFKKANQITPLAFRELYRK
ncbi:AraC family transcriptional regulator [Mucilaginibacter sp. PAMB04168]|uniref:helix-turn-helix domain-containing protein n=1 Tax=Mucilaginibacter sp. PAMB04168 TaxID=3138567 RepID=UPI0031F6D0F8